MHESKPVASLGRFAGPVLTAVVTPFLEDLSLDLPALRSILAYQKASGLAGVVLLGSTGEAATLTELEREQVLLVGLEYQDTSFSVYVGTGSNDSRVALERSLRLAGVCAANGERARGLLLVTPYYNRPSQEHLLRHYTDICQELYRAYPATTVCVYNVPARTGTHLLPETFVQIARANPNVVAIKEASGSLAVVSELAIGLREAGFAGVRILSGDDAAWVPALFSGAEGVISVTAQFIPAVFMRTAAAYAAGNCQQVRDLHLAAWPLNQGIFRVVNPVGIKWVLAQYGFCTANVRAPLYAANREEAKLLGDLLVQLEKNLGRELLPARS